jgi:hypothetical protein
MTRVTIFTSTIGDGPAKLTVAVIRNFDSSDPFTVQLGSDAWPLATADAERLAAAGRRIEGRFDLAAQHGEQIEGAPFFRRQLGNSDQAATFEIGIDAGGQFAAVYLEWNGRRIVDGTGRLLKMLSVLGESTQTIRQTAASRHTQDIRIDPQNYHSPYGWNGQ